MSNHFVKLPPGYLSPAAANQRQAAGGLHKFPGGWQAPFAIITANERLASEYRRCVEDALQQRFAVWTTPPIYSISNFLRAELDTVQQNSGREFPTSTAEQIKTALFANDPTLPGHVLHHFADAYDLIHAYDIDLNCPELGDTPLQAWLKGVQACLPDTLYHPSAIPSLLLEHNQLPRLPLWLVGFETLDKPLRRYLRTLQKHGLIANAEHGILEHDADALPPVPTQTDADLRSFESLHDELAHAAAWAREIKLRKPTATIGIVVPYLGRHYDLVLRQIGLGLDPLRGSLGTCFDISGGVPLHTTAVWEAAQTLLEVALHGADQAAARSLYASPYLELPGFEAAALRWPHRLPRRASLEQIWVHDEVFDFPVPLAAYRGAYKTLSEWSLALQNLLTACGWPRITDLGSVQFQAASKVMELLERWGQTAHPDAPQFSSSQALALIGELMSTTLFAPQRETSDIRVLGLLETTGLDFSHLWVCGMTAGEFPAHSKANPFIPARVATRHGVPRSNPLQEWLFASQLLARWQAQARELHFSFCARDADGAVTPSPLVADGARDKQETTAPIALGSLARHPLIASAQPAQLHERIDQFGLTCKPGPVTGGTGLLKAQQECAFKGYAHYRLGLREPMPAYDLPNAAARGSLVHNVLQTLVGKYRGAAALLALSRHEIERTCAEHLQREGRLPAPFVQHEIGRITHLVLRWLEVEARREPFDNVQVESEHRVDFAGLVFSIRIDRIDRVADHLVLIDYKTGDIKTVLPPARAIEDPQLPIYSLVDDAVQGVYFGRVRADYCALLGLSAPDAQIEGARSKTPDMAWTEQRDAWRTRLEALAMDFQRGYAAVDPQPKACDYCNLRSLCRVGSREEDDEPSEQSPA
ncbi:MAG: PD-(D/E)XK nuclease family protein [Pseudomonadota bacterium]